jgi:transcriptional regulator NrdR family protein
MVRKRDDRLEPFFESKLLVSLLRAANNQLRHDDVHELLRTIKKNIVRTGQSGQVKSTTISEAVAETLARYDPKMLARYQAYAK